MYKSGLMISRQVIFVLLFSTFLFSGCEPQLGRDKIMDGLDGSTSSSAVNYLRSAIAAQPEIIENYLVLAQIFLAENKDVQAEKLLETAYGRASDHPGIIYLLSKRYLDQGAFPEALAILKKAEQKEIFSFGLFKNFARVYYRTGEFSLMPLYVNKALQYDPDDWEMVFYKGEVAREAGDRELAFSNYELAYQLNPSDSIFNSMYDYALMCNDVDRVSRYMDAEYVKHPDSPDLLLRAGSHFRSEGRQDTSLLLYQKVVGMAPDDPVGYKELAQYFFDMRGYDSARYYADRAIALDNGYLESRLIKARALDRIYQYAESIDEYNEIIRLDPNNAIARSELAKLENKIAYLRDLRRIREQKENLNIIKIPQAKKLKP